MREGLLGVKRLVGQLPILTKPRVGEKLWVYLAMSEVVVNAVLVWKEEGKQYPMYYISY